MLSTNTNFDAKHALAQKTPVYSITFSRNLAPLQPPEAGEELDIELLDSIDDGGAGYDVWGDGTYLYLANYTDGLRAYTFNGNELVNVGHIDSGGSGFDVWGDGTYIYLANYDDGLRAYTFDGSTFVSVGNINPGGYGYAVWGDGTYIYYAAGSSGLYAYTFNGSSFTQVGYVAPSGTCFGVWGDGTYIYLATYSALRAYTFNGSTFNNVGFTTNPNSSYDVWGDGTYIYVANGGGGLHAYTFNGSTFTLAGSIDDGGIAYDLFVYGDFIILGNDTDGLRVYTFDGATFTCVFHDSGDGSGTWSDGTYIFIANDSYGLYAYGPPGAINQTVTSLETGGELISISGLSRSITPEKGKSSIAGINATILDEDDAITGIFASDAYYLHRAKAVVKAGYHGMDADDYLTIFTGWVTGYKLTSDATAYEFEITDPQKWLQRKIFRSATDAAPVTLSGNPINILLAVLTSTGDSDNGDYDWYENQNGVGLDATESVNVAAIEAVRDTWYPGDSYYMSFTITSPIKAKEFIETEILQVLNCYPAIDGQGRYSIIPFKPPVYADQTQDFDEDVIIGIPTWDGNLSSMINEIEFHFDYDHEDNEFDSKTLYENENSIFGRGPGKDVLTIKSKGLHSEHNAANIIAARKTAIFNRYSAPPIKIKAKSFFSQYLTEPGDIVRFTHSKLPDITAGTRGLTNVLMEVVNQKIDWQRGIVNTEFLQTGFLAGRYGKCSPIMTITAASSGTAFTVSTAHAALWTAGWEAQIVNALGRQIAASITILTIDTGTGAVTCDDIGQTPEAGWHVLFADWDNCTTDQQQYGFIADTDNLLGADDDAPNYCSP